MTARVITIHTQKGGVGKTTTAVNLSHGLALAGRSVLLLDLDPQGHAATSLGLRPEEGAYYLLLMGASPRDTEFVRQWVRDTGRNNLHLIAGDQRTNAAQLVLNAQERSKSIDLIRRSLERFIRTDLDYIVIDTAPSVGGIAERALFAADYVLIPTSTEYLATDSVKSTVQMLKTLKTEFSWRGSLAGILPTFFHDQLREHRAARDELHAGYTSFVLPPIHRAAILGECPGESKTIFEKDPSSRSAQEYQALVKHILRLK